MKLRSRNKTSKQLQLEKFIPLVEECWINSNMTFSYREIYNELVNVINLSMVRRIKLKSSLPKRVTTANNQHQKRMYMMT